MGTVEAAGPKRARRINFLRPVHLRTAGQAGPPKRMFASRLSRNGMFIRSPVPLPVGTQVEVLLEAKGRVLRFADAVVVNVLGREQAQASGRLPGFGIRFTSLAPRSRALVDELLRLTAEPPAPVRRPVQVPPSARATRITTPAPRRGSGRVAVLATLAAAIALGGWAQWAGLIPL